MTISASALPMPHEPIRLHVTRRATIDTEGPYLDEYAPTDPGSVPLAAPPARPSAAPHAESSAPPEPAAPAAQLRLVPAELPPARLKEGTPTDTVAASFGPVRTPRVELPAPGPQAARLTRLLLEVLAGDRPARQLAACANPDVCDEVEVLVSPRSPRPWAGSLRRLVVCEPVPGIAEVTAIVVQGLRTVALALRMEGVDGRWQLTALELA
ncbi:MAG TPA: Rv3235 family protein [Mycobacteriales bacterium]|nr:Rv3235 family protein [Mycobacteriales bacterium]